MSEETKVELQSVTLGGRISLEQFMAVVRYGAKVDFSDEYRKRVSRSRILLEEKIAEKQVMYGVTTGFGSLSKNFICSEDSAKLQENIILSHAVSVGAPYTREEARATMLMILQNLGQGYSGVRMRVLETVAGMLNRGVIPWIPRDGSVGYLACEAHMALVIIGRGKALWNGEWMPGPKAMELAGVKTLTLEAKEGLALTSGTTSVTALGAIALYDLLQAAKSADIIASLTLESLMGQMAAFDQRVMTVRPHPDQGDTADNVRRILADSEIIRHYKGCRVQDALSLRCIPQLHGAAKHTLRTALETIEIEINSCCDNPLVWDDDDVTTIISSCNCDSSYVGLSMDNAAIAATMLAKMSERRNNRLIDNNLSQYPDFLISNPGLNSGLMVPQYTQAGLLGDMRMLSSPACVENTPTCANQEDYVAMGYNASKKAIQIAQNLEYILAIELLSGVQAQKFLDQSLARGAATHQIIDEISLHVPQMEQDEELYPHIEYLRELIHSGRLVKITEEVVGKIL